MERYGIGSGTIGKRRGLCPAVMLPVTVFLACLLCGCGGSVDTASAKAGDVVTFGSYEQDNDKKNGKEPIEWLVLDKEGTKLLLVSRYALDCEPYNKGRANVTWETCTLRGWLNGTRLEGTFINEAFSAGEQERIIQITLQNPGNNKKGGKTTQDRVFLLSADEVNGYFPPDDARRCSPTAYACARGAFKAGDGHCGWWLRDSGMYACAAYVRDDGRVDGNGSPVFGVTDEHGHRERRDNVAVRPAMWIDAG